MDPLTGLAIYGTAEALKGILGAQAAEQERQRMVGAQKAQGVFDLTQNKLSQQQSQQQGALSDLIAAYRSNLGVAK